MSHLDLEPITVSNILSNLFESFYNTKDYRIYSSFNPNNSNNSNNPSNLGLYTWSRRTAELFPNFIYFNVLLIRCEITIDKFLKNLTIKLTTPGINIARLHNNPKLNSMSKIKTETHYYKIDSIKQISEELVKTIYDFLKINKNDLSD